MEDFKNKINQILEDPNALDNIVSMAKNLGFLSPSPDQAEDHTAQQYSHGESSSAPIMPGLDEFPLPMMELLSEFGKIDGKQTALFNAIKPFIRPGRRDKIDRAIKAAQISHMAGYAIKKLEQK